MIPFNGWLISIARNKAIQIFSGTKIAAYLILIVRDFITCLSLRDFAEYDENNYDVIFTMVRVETTKKQFVVKAFDG